MKNLAWTCLFAGVVIFLASLFSQYPIKLNILEITIWSVAVFVVIAVIAFILSLLPKELRKDNVKVNWAKAFMIFLFTLLFFTIFGSPNIEPKVPEKVVWGSVIFAIFGAISALSALQDKKRQKN